MNLKDAITVFEHLERERTDFEGTSAPTYDVRLDADHDRDDKRTFRIRVTAGPWGIVSEDAWRFVLDLAQRYEASVDIQNAGMELR